MTLVALEEHFSHPDLLRGVGGPIAERLLDLGDLRLRELDEAGIDLQVISHFPPGPQNLAADIAIPLTREVNDSLAAAIARHPNRFAGLASLPLAAPDEAAEELRRSVEQLGFKGAIIHGRGAGAHLDDPRFRPLFAAAVELAVPIYLHPDRPPEGVVADYYQGRPELLTAGWAYTVDAATQALRLMAGGVFDEFTTLQIILGHMGETLPFHIVRADAAITAKAKLRKSLRETFRENFWITVSGSYSNPALIASVLELGVDRIMFGADWPFGTNTEAVDFLDQAPISTADRHRIADGNARRLLRL